MSNIAGDIMLNIKAQIDTSDVDKSMSQVANNSAQSIEKAFNSLDKSIKSSLADVTTDIQKIGGAGITDVFQLAANAVSTFKERMDQVKLSGESLDIISTKWYKIEESLAHAGEKVLELQEDFSQINELAKVRVSVEEKFGDIDTARNRLRELKLEYNQLSLGLTGVNQDAYNPILEQLTKVKELKAQLSELRSRYNELGASSDAGTKGNVEKMKQLELEMRAVTSQIGNASKALYAMGREANFGNTQAQIERVLDAIKQFKNVSAELEPLKAAMSDVEQEEGLAAYTLATLNQDVERFTSKYSQLLQVAEAMREISESADESAEEFENTDTSMKEMNATMSQLRNVAWAFSRVLGNIYTIGLDIYRIGKNIANVYMKIWSVVKKIVGVFQKLRDNIKKTGEEHAKSWKQMLKDIIRYSLGIRSLFMLFRRLRRYIKEAFEAMAEQIPEVNKTLSELKSSFNMLKGSMATALEPIISAITPALLRLIDIFSTLLTYIGMFFAALTGRGYVYKANKSMTSFADATGSAADKAKELNKQLQGFDELNNLTTKENKDSGGGAGPLANFEKVPVPDWIKDLADKIREIFEKIMDPIKKAWEKVGDYVIAAWKRAAKALKNLLSDILRDFLKAWEKWGEPIFTRIFQIIGDIGMIIGNIAIKLREAWNANDNGLKIWNAILEIIYKIVDGIRKITLDMFDWTLHLDLTPGMTAFREWLESCVPVAEALMDILFDLWNDALKPILTWTFDGENSGIAKLFNIFRDFNKKVDWQKLRRNLDKIWKAIGRFGEKLGEGLLEFIQGLADSLANWINSEDFERTCDKIVEFFDNIEVKDIKDDLDQVWRIVKNIAEQMKKAIDFLLEHKDTILNTLEFISEHLEGILITVGGFKLAIDFGRLLMNIFLLRTAIWKLSGGEGLGYLIEEVLGVEATFGSLSGVIGGLLADFALLAGALAIIGAALSVAFDKDVMQSSKDLLADLGQTAKDFFSGKDMTVDYQNLEADWKEFCYSLKGAFYENVIVPFANFFDVEIPQTFEEFKQLNQQVEGTQNALRYLYEDIESGALPSMKEMRDVVKDNTTTAEEYKNEMEKLKNKLFEASPELDNLALAMEDNNVKGHDNIDTLEQISVGLDEFRRNGGSAKDTCKYLNEEFGYTDKSAKDFFTRLAKGKDDVTAVADSMGYLTENTKKAVNELPTSKDGKDKATDLISGYNEGITENETKTEGPIKSWAKNILKWFTDTDALDSHSPSKATKAIGKDTVDGFNKGIEENEKTSVKTMTGLAKSILNGFKDGINKNQSVATGAVDTLSTKIVNKFTTMKNNIVNVFNGLASTIGGILNSIGNSIRNKFNEFTSMISGLKDGINGATSNINNKFNLSIPKLAQGAVIPPNNEFLAVLGDQKRGTNIETPLDTMIQAFNAANRGGNEQELILLQEQNDLLRQLLNKEFGISSDDIFRSVKSSAKIYKKATGNSAFA